MVAYIVWKGEKKMPENVDYIVNGYAYPSISQETLQWWLPRISWVSCFSYGFTGGGQLIDLKDYNLTAPANAAGVRPMMVLTPMDEQGRFSDAAAVEVFRSPAAKENLINNIEENIKNKNMGGIDFDFEYLNAEYADDYVSLVADTAARLRPQGFLTTVALAPKTSADQQGLLYQGHDYAGMGQAADYCLLMTYEWGYTYGPPMPVSPISNVRRVVEYGLTEIPAEKILMGMSNYGYDWALPFVRGESKAEKLTNYQALGRAEYYGVQVEYDEQAQAPFFTYTTAAGVDHIVWFENERSWQARLAMVAEYGLAGVSIWNIMNIFYGGI